MTMAESDKYIALVYGTEFQRCPKTDRPFERGSGALSQAQQTANFIREAARAADIPKMGEHCSQTGREFDCSVAALPRSIQTQQFLSELSPAQKAQRRQNFDALVAVAPAGSA
jgi:hypothetical protein